MSFPLDEDAFVLLLDKDSLVEPDIHTFCNREDSGVIIVKDLDDKVVSSKVRSENDTESRDKSNMLLSLKSCKNTIKSI